MLYVVGGFVSGGLLLGWITTAANYALLSLYLVGIKWWTRDASIPKASKRQLRRDLVVIGVFLAIALGAFTLTRIAGAQPWVGSGLDRWLHGQGLPDVLSQEAAMAARNTVLILVPFLLAALFAGLRLSELGLKIHRLGLGATATGIGVAIAAIIWRVSGTPTVLFAAGPLIGLAALALQLLVNGIWEETVFRGFLISRLETYLSSRNSLVIAGMLFNAAHLPSLLGANTGLPRWALIPLALAGFQPTALAWGYLFQRTRSIWPGALWHASYGTLGAPFLG